MVSTEKSAVLPGLLWRSKTAQGLSGSSGLHHRSGRRYSIGFGGVSRMGITELDLARADCVFADGISGGAHACVGVRHYRGWDSGHP